MPYNPDVHHRRSIRLKGWDYTSPGAYFITACTEERLCLFGEIVDHQMRLNEHGLVVQNHWKALTSDYPNVELDTFIVMPNHMHGIILLKELRPTQKRFALPQIVRHFKIHSARRINSLRRTEGVPVWQRDYYEHIVRDADELNAIRIYIENNPANWQIDLDNIL